MKFAFHERIFSKDVHSQGHRLCGMLLQAHEQTPQATDPWAPVVTLVHTAPHEHRSLAPQHLTSTGRSSLLVSNSLLQALGHLAVEARSSPAFR